MGLPVLAESISSYIVEVNRYPLLSQEEELTIAERYFKLKRTDDAHALVTANLRYVLKIALEYRSYGCRLADLVQEGNIGLMVAVKKFNPSKGFRLITYATWWIRSYIQDFILKSFGLVKNGSRALKKKLFYKSDGYANDGTEAVHDLSLNSPISDDATTHQDLLSDTAPAQEELMSTMQERSIRTKDVESALTRLNDRERRVVEGRFMSDEPMSLQEIGDELGVSRERVRQIEVEAKKKLQKALSASIEPA